MPVETAKELVTRYLNLPSFQDHETKQLYFQISFNARAVQFFLQECARYGSQLTTDQITFAQVQGWIDNAFEQWTNTVSRKLKDNSQWAAWLIMLCTHPAVFDATDCGDTILVPKEKVPIELVEATKEGAFGFINSNSNTIYKSKGFLFKYLRNQAMDLHYQDLASIFAWTEKIGAPGHLFERLVATELTNPLSGFYTTIIRAEGKLVSSYEVSWSPVQYEPNIAALSSLKNQVHCVKDTNAKHNRIVDVAVPFQTIASNEEVIVYMDCKTVERPDKLWKACHSFFVDSRIPPEHPRIFLSLYPFQNTEPKESTHNEGLSAAQASQKVKKLLETQPCKGGWLKYAILDGEESFKKCQLKISKATIKDLEAEITEEELKPSNPLKRKR